MIHNIKERVKQYSKHNEFYLFIVFVLLITSISIINPRFLNLENMLNIMRQYAFIGILSMGFLVVLISGGIDISFTANATVAQYLMALVLSSNPDIPIVVVIIIPIVIGTVLGSVNALLIHFLKAPSIIITIATLNAYYGALQFFSRGRWIYEFPEWFRSFPLQFLITFTDATGRTYGLSVLTGIWFALVAVCFVMLKYTKLGRYIYAKGGNLEGMRRAGGNILGLRLFAYSFLGFTAGIGAIVHAMVTQTVAPNALLGQEFDVLTAVVLGGASIFGGTGTISGTMLGVGLIALIKNGLTIMRVPEYWHQVFIGLVLLISVCVTAMQQKIARNKERLIDVN